jgi:hypothetical protein
MIGYLYTFDEFGHFLSDRSHVKVTAIGVGQSYSASSNSKGNSI